MWDVGWSQSCCCCRGQGRSAGTPQVLQCQEHVTCQMNRSCDFCRSRLLASRLHQLKVTFSLSWVARRTSWHCMFLQTVITLHLYVSYRLKFLKWHNLGADLGVYDVLSTLDKSRLVSHGMYKMTTSEHSSDHPDHFLLSDSLWAGKVCFSSAELHTVNVTI